MRYAKYAKILRHATVRSHLWHSMDENAICVYYFFIHLFLSSQLKYIIIFKFSHSFSASPSLLSHTLFFSLLPFCSILFPFMNHEPPPISSLPSQKFHHHWSIKSHSPVFSPLFSPFFALFSLIYDLICQETETAQAHHWSLTHFATKRNSSVKDTVAGSENFHQWRRQRRLSSFDCRSWKVTNTEGGERKKCLGVCLALTHPKCLSVCPIQFMILVYIVINFIIDLVDLGCGFVPISLVVFFFEVVLVDVGSCQWWLSVLLQ